VLLSLEIEEKDETVKKNLASSLELNLGKNTNLSLGTATEVLQEYSSEISRIYLNSAGLMEPIQITGIDPGDETSTDSGVYTVSLQDVVDFKAAVNQRVVNAFDPSNIHDPAYGVILDAKRRRYMHSQLDACGLEDPSLSQAYECVTNSFTTAGRFQDSTGKMEQILAQISDYLTYDEDFTWSGSVTKMQNKLKQVRTRIRDCRQNIPSLNEQCSQVLENGSPSDYCSACTVGQDCDVGKIVSKFENVSGGIRRERAEGAEEHNSHRQSGPGATESGTLAKDSLCVLQKVSGKFSTDNDGVRLSINSNTHRWRLDVSEEGNGSRPQEYRHNSKMACVGRAEFHDSSRTSPTFTVSGEKEIPTRVKSGNTDEVKMGPNDNLARAVSQYNGTSNGLGEWVRTLPPDPQTGAEGKVKASSAAIVSNDYGIKGSAFKFGFPGSDAAAPMSQKYQVSANGGKEDRMIPKDEGICYLTNVSGEFDGGGERASIYLDGYHWYVSVDSVCHSWFARQLHPNDCDNKEIQATARCYKYEH
jgi:hypothetical protein